MSWCVKCNQPFIYGQEVKVFEGKRYCLNCWNIGNPNKTETIEPLEDVINKPSHYHQNGIDVIGFSELQFKKEELKGFFRINVLKYVTRYDKKNNVEDLEKASFYLNKLIGLEEGSEAKPNKRMSKVLQLQEENLNLTKEIERLKLLVDGYFEWFKKSL